MKFPAKKLAIVGIFSIGFVCGFAFFAFYTNPPSYHLSHKESAESNSVVNNHLKPFQFIKRDGYSLYYDNRLRLAGYVYEQLHSETLNGSVSRKNFRFREDALIPPPFRASFEDYKNTGFDKGHLAPAANHKKTAKSMGDTFYLSNVSPQNQALNRGYWARLEEYIRQLTDFYPVVHVFTGPLFVPQEAGNGKKYVSYEVIGKNDIAVPTHFFKVILCQKTDGSFFEKAFIVPNKAVPSNTPIEKYLATVNKVEHLTGAFFRLEAP